MNDIVSTPHPMYGPQQAKRQVFADVQSTDSMRAAGKRHLPEYPAEDEKEYNERLASATIDGIVAGGVDTLSGAVFEGDIDTSKVNASIVPLLENIDNKGNHFNVFAREAFEASFDGFSVIVVDMPVPDIPVVSREDQQRAGMRPYWRLYKAQDVINWRFRVNPVNKQQELQLIVFKECTEEPDGRFLTKTVTRYRVWHLDPTPKWEVWIDPGNGKEPILESQGVITGTVLPVAFVGCVEDDPKLLVESRLEIKAYQKESSFDVIEYLSIPTFYTKGYDGDQKLQLGASAWVKLPADAAAEVGYAQIDAAGHDSLKATFTGIKEYIKSRLNLDVSAAMQSADKTATQVAVEDKDKQARLVVWAEQLKDALETALMYTAEMMNLGADKGGEIILKTKWVVAQEQAQAMQDAMANAQANANS